MKIKTDDIVSRETTFDEITRQECAISKAESRNGRYSMTIAANDDVGDGRPINLRTMNFDRYRKNPVVLFAHDRYDNVPIGRTISINRDSAGLITVEFEFLSGDSFAQRVKNAWDKGFLRAASISAKPLINKDVEAGVKPYDSREDVKWEMTEWSIVPIPADPDAVRSIQRDIFSAMFPEKESTGETNMDPNELEKIIARALESHGDKPDAGAIAREVAEAVGETITEAVKREVESVVAEREEAQEKQRAAEDEAAETKRQAEEDAEAKAREADEYAEKRADLLVMVRGLIADDAETNGKTNRELLALACGNEVKDADERSEDYLLAKVEGIIARRAEGENKPADTKPAENGKGSAETLLARSGGRINMINLKNRSVK